MVDVAGTGWRLAPSLVTYVQEADSVYPQRDRNSDGSIGDLAHQSRTSDHNPDDDGWVCAVDLDEDLAPGLDLKAFAEQLRQRRDRRIAYVIYEGRTFKSYPRNGYEAWAWQPYTGENAHLHHLHLSITHDDARFDTSPWGFAPVKEEDMPLDETDKQWLRDLLADCTGPRTDPNLATVPDGEVRSEVWRWSRESVLFARKATAELAALKSAVAQLGAGGSIDYSKVEAAAENAVRDVLGGLG